MRKGFTVTLDYFATGEGMTRALMYSFGSEADALNEFTKHVGEYFARCAEIKEGIDLDCRHARLLLSEPVKNMLKADDFGAASFFCQAYFNFS
jgi:hypothetical protein